MLTVLSCRNWSRCADRAGRLLSIVRDVKVRSHTHEAVCCVQVRAEHVRPNVGVEFNARAWLWDDLPVVDKSVGLLFGVFRPAAMGESKYESNLRQ